MLSRRGVGLVAKKNNGGGLPSFNFKTPTNSQFLILVSLLFTSLAGLSFIGYKTFLGGTQYILVAVVFAIFAVYAHQNESK
ncbi:hypothetical protein COX24_00300 [bacterium (Candidatus Gribaldobacteria) CG23_combo_of_CG06-09_8_20_14_all_37_87_8]|uniref:Uncharacterized protein n=1 Tax=bacterium (Candidatus Gribaldobacteria) CG23_combo_of_CG06-09_8_20_14_all_37_87_8 TaxID=2014278 RepID=A0A2G9ZFW8_9BACT|nr:MAG: hypothetical protein COX24_00300 [bacterium (Candidatus Gribaldobacteria) CG23_combo_of_CG06-09_8_20_14_all_37_87_8]